MADDLDTHTPPAAPAGAKGAGWNKKFLHVPVWGWAMGAGGLAAVGFYWWKHRKGGTAATTTNATSNTVPVSNCRDAVGDVTPCTGCTDSNGNTVPCTSGGYGGGGGGTSGSTTTSPTTSQTSGTTAPTKYATNPPSGFKGTPTTDSITFTWAKQSSPATGFQLTVYDGATIKADDTFPNSSVGTTIGGLKASNKYVCKLRAQPQAPGSFGNSITVTTKAAAKPNPGGPNKPS